MDFNTKLLLSGIVILMLVSIFLSYRRTIVERDFETFNSEAEIIE